ncbi:MAG: preprotein translocase subunit SecG [Verrucomicrobiota bacterium]|jgi:protein translocase SecG subunit
MTFIAGILTVLLFINCLLLILLVLVQLPKKDAGAGIAFGGGAADALFGAGSGNALTKITKWATGIFFGMCLVLGVVKMGNIHSDTPTLEQIKQAQQKQSQMPAAAPPGTPVPVAPATTSNSSSSPAIPADSVPATPQPK